jgi:DNA-binding NtrC family response regulator
MKDSPQLVGTSARMKDLGDEITRLLLRARGRRPPAILIQGETGTGKGLVASLLHRGSARAQGPFVDVNCAAIPDSLLETELFGFERGAFTDARRSKPGLFQVAHGGALFLDEVGLLPLPLQAKLLAVLEDGAVRRVGATRKEAADVWIISASNVDLQSEVRARRFREDLYHRLAVVTIAMPALRERAGDIALLAEHFLQRVRAEHGLPPLDLGPDARERLQAHSWPGNVRELANAIERAALLGDPPLLTAASLGLDPCRPIAPAGLAEAGPARPAAVASRDAVLREHLRDVLRQCAGNITRTARVLGVSRNTVRAHIRKFGVTPDGGTRPAADARARRSRGGAASPGELIDWAAVPPTSTPWLPPAGLPWSAGDNGHARSTARSEPCRTCLPG